MKALKRCPIKSISYVGPDAKKDGKQWLRVIDLHPLGLDRRPSTLASRNLNNTLVLSEGKGGGHRLLATTLKELELDQIKIRISISKSRTIGLLL